MHWLGPSGEADETKGTATDWQCSCQETYPQRITNLGEPMYIESLQQGE